MGKTVRFFNRVNICHHVCCLLSNLKCVFVALSSVGVTSEGPRGPARVAAPPRAASLCHSKRVHLFCLIFSAFRSLCTFFFLFVLFNLMYFEFFVVSFLQQWVSCVTQRFPSEGIKRNDCKLTSHRVSCGCWEHLKIKLAN